MRVVVSLSYHRTDPMEPMDPQLPERPTLRAYMAALLTRIRPTIVARLNTLTFLNEMLRAVGRDPQNGLRMWAAATDDDKEYLRDLLREFQGLASVIADGSGEHVE